MTRRELLMTSTAVLPPERTEPEGWYGAVDRTIRDGDQLEVRYTHGADGRTSGAQWRVVRSLDELAQLDAEEGERVYLYDDRDLAVPFADGDVRAAFRAVGSFPG
jgi:hypothetical protein